MLVFLTIVGTGDTSFESVSVFVSLCVLMCVCTHMCTCTFYYKSQINILIGKKYQISEMK